LILPASATKRVPALAFFARAGVGNAGVEWV
jgi:hypothetical protein